MGNGSSLVSVRLSLAIGALLSVSTVLRAVAAQGALQRDRLASVRIPFVENQGQLPREVAYSASTFFGTVFVTSDGKLVYSMVPGDAILRQGARKSQRHASTVTEKMVSGTPRVTPGHPATTGISSFLGADPRRWRTCLRGYEEVELGEVWPGVSVTVRPRGRSVEKVFTLSPGARVGRIRLSVDGVLALRIDRDRSIVGTTRLGSIHFTAPTAYQVRHGVRYDVSVAYVLDGKTYGFRLGAHDVAFPVIVDPILQTTYVGGSANEGVYSVTVHPASGDVLVAGTTNSTDFPGTTGGAQPTGGGVNEDVFLARLNPELTQVLQATFLGGSDREFAPLVTVDPQSGDVLIAGYTSSIDFPGTNGGAQPVPGGDVDGFVARLDSSLTALLQATYLGGSYLDDIEGLSVHPTTGEVFLAGTAASTDFPGTLGGAQPVSQGSGDGFVARLNSGLTSLLQATYLGGSLGDAIRAVAINPSGTEILVGGETQSTDFPATAGGAQPTSNGNDSGFLASLTPDLTAIIQATYLSGDVPIQLGSIAVHPSSGEVLAAGYTSLTDFPGTVNGAQPTFGGGYSDGLVVRYDSGLTSLLQATFLGGTFEEYPTALIVNPTSGDVLVAGSTSSRDFPGTAGGVQPAPGGDLDGFVARLNPALTSLLQATYFGGFYFDQISGIVLNPTSGELLAAGGTSSVVLPFVTGGAQPVPGGVEDGFVVRLTADLAASENLSFFTLPPCRLLDTRATQAPLAAMADSVIEFSEPCGIPTGAQAVSLNVTVTQPTAEGHLVLYPSGTSRPLASTINYRKGQTRAGNAIIRLGDGGAIKVYCAQESGAVDLILDLNGYFQ